MRIISGIHKGRRLNAPKSLPVRPTTDFAKEALFNILRNNYYFDEINVLDLFAGTGNISFEFASRGTLEITSVDEDFGCIKYIEKISSELAMPIIAIKSDVIKYLEKNNGKFDVIFADPPYDFTLETLGTIVELVTSNTMLKEDGFLIIEHSKLLNLDALPHFSEARNYGGSVFSFFM